MARRIRWLGAVMILCMTVVLVQLGNVQFKKAPSLAGSPLNPRNQVNQFDNPRGDILASNGAVLAKSVKARTGAYKFERIYPSGSLFAQTVGYSSYYLGTSGVEYQYDHYLTPHSQPIRTLDQWLSPPPKTSDTVSLTVNPSLQSKARQLLAGRDGAVVVIVPSTGSILAMYSNPTYDPNPLASPSIPVEKAADFADNVKDSEGFAPFDSLAYHESFAPGSTFKMVTTSAVYDLKPNLSNFSAPVLSQTPLPGTNKPFHNYAYEACGGTIAQLLPPSCDTGYALLGIQLGSSALYTQARSFGFDAVPPIDLPDVAASSFPTPKQLATNLPGVAYSAIGQLDVSATALQMALVAAGVANSGTVMTPHVMSQVRDDQGDLITSFQPKPWLQATTPQTASTLTKLMQSVVTAPNGTANGVFPPHINAAAKTGTAETGVFNQFTTDWMIAFAPANAPRVAVAVVVPQQSASATGSSVTGPIISAMIQAALSATAGGR